MLRAHWRKWLLAALAAALVCLALMLLPRPARVPDAWDGNTAALGLLLQEEADGLFILAVRDDSPAQRAGLAPGDRLLAVNGSAFTTLADLETLLTASLPESGVTFLARRSGSQQVIAVISPP